MDTLARELRPDTVYEDVRVTTLADGHSLVVPIHRLVGERSGPRLALVALLHGDETLPNEIVRRVLTSVDRRQLRGEIVATPAAHGPALEALSRNSPLDMLDLNRSFPGDPSGWITEQLAHTLSSVLLDGADALIDLHSGGLHATVEYVYLAEEGRELALALGWKHNYIAATPHPGGLLGVARARGVPGAILEVGGGAVADGEMVDKGVRALLNALRHLDMLDGEIEVPEPQIVFTSLATIRPRAGGMLYPEVGLDRLGGDVGGGELLGRVVSPLTYEVLEELRSPFERGHLLLLRGAVGRINPGDFAYMVGDADSGEYVQ
jgi:predicted deacylase